jgi:WD40 repeat protein
MCNSNLRYQCVARLRARAAPSSRSMSNRRLPSYSSPQLDRLPVQPQRDPAGRLRLRRLCLHLPPHQRALQSHRLLSSVTPSSRSDEAAIWKVTWADPAYGDAIAIGTFKRKVAVFQLRTGTWTEIAFHELHEGSVNHVEWASADYGCKLFSAGSDGSVAILELKKNAWVSSSFFAHECSVTSMSVRPVPLSEAGE